jgi:nitrate/nitrite-specific signal transduction histidine kinase
MINGIKEISNKNFDQQLKINSSDEFGEMADAFNEMAKKLDENEHSNLSK